MRIVHLIVFKLMSLVVLVAGVVLIGMYFNVLQIYDNVTNIVGPNWRQIAPVAGAILFILGLLGLLPLSRRKRPSTISFPGEYGEVTIHLDSIEATLNRIVSKMPEVKKISVRLIPSEDNRKATVTGSLWIYKGSEAAGVSEIVGKVQKHLRDTAINILGVEEIVMGRLDVPGIIVSATPSKPAPPAVPKEAAIVPAPQPAPPAVIQQPGPVQEAPAVEEQPPAEEEPPVSTAFEPEDLPKSESEAEPLAWGARNDEEKS